jgi:hypothetical protein
MAGEIRGSVERKWLEAVLVHGIDNKILSDYTSNE